MSVLIKGMEMPKSCEKCKFSWWDVGNFYCEADGKPWGLEVTGCTEKRHPNCPLIEVPPHGRLIDLDGTALAQYYDVEHEEWSMETVTVEDILWGVCENMPPIVIPADKDGESR